MAIHYLGRFTSWLAQNSAKETAVKTVSGYLGVLTCTSNNTDDRHARSPNTDDHNMERYCVRFTDGLHDKRHEQHERQLALDRVFGAIVKQLGAVATLQQESATLRYIGSIRPSLSHSD